MEHKVTMDICFAVSMRELPEGKEKRSTLNVGGIIPWGEVPDEIKRRNPAKLQYSSLPVSRLQMQPDQLILAPDTLTSLPSWTVYPRTKIALSFRVTSARYMATVVRKLIEKETLV